jgi:hypothetical protein
MKRENFILTRVKLVSGGVEADYIDRENPNSHMSETRQQNPHPDLKEAVNLLRTMVASATHLTALHDLEAFIKSETGKKEYQGILAKCQSMQADILENIAVSGISIKGEDDKRAVVITSVLTCKGKKTALNTARILLNGDVYGKEEALSEDIDTIIEEVYLYLFEGKTSQLAMEFQEVEGEE